MSAHGPAEHVARLAARVLVDVEALTDRLVDAILAADPPYTAGRTAHEDLRRSCRDNLVRILQSLTGAAPDGVDLHDAPRETGRRRAEQGIPLESVLHAFRLGHRSIWDALVEQAREDGSLTGLVEAASHVWEIVDAFSSEVGRSYRQTEAQITRRDARRREALLDALLSGSGRERAVAAEAAAGLDLPEQGTFVVVALAGTDGGRPAEDALAVRGIRAAWLARSDREVGLVAVPAPGVEEVVRVLEGIPGLRGGLSPAVCGLAEVDAAYRLADTALRARGTAPGVGSLDDRLPAALLVSAPDLAARLVTRALGGVLELEPTERDLLLETLSAWIDAGGSASQTAARLFCHRNTVLNRLRRVEVLTGRSPDRVDHMVEWALALRAREVLPPSGTMEA